MKKHTVTTYSFDELSKEAQERAIEDHRTFLNETMNDFLPEVMADQLSMLLDEHKITNSTDHESPKVQYSLSNSQGDGAMFTGGFIWEGYSVSIEHRDNHYCHVNTAYIEMYETDNDNNEHEILDDEKPFKDFWELYKKICKALEKYGYDYIDYELESEHVAEEIRLNEYEFNKDGSLFTL